MKALIKKDRGFGNVELLDIEEPECKKSEIKIRVRAVGICGSDLHIYEGNFPYYNVPVILGHEFTGEIVEIGKNAKNYKGLNVNDRVVVLPSAAVICGKCEYCMSGNFIFCPSRKGMGHGINGGFTEYVCVREELVYKLHDNISFETGTLVEPLACCMQSVDSYINILPTDNILVSGSGTIGLLVLALLKLRNCRVALAGISKDRIRFEAGKSIGADLTINVDEQNIGEIIVKELGISSFDICFECAGINDSLNNCINYLKKMGYLIQMGLYGEDSNINFNSIVTGQLTIVGSMGFTWKTWEKSIKVLRDNLIKSNLFITHTYKLSEWKDAFNKAKEADSIKVCVTLD